MPSWTQERGGPAPGGLLQGLRTVSLAARRPVACLVVLLYGVGATVGLLAGRLGPPLAAAGAALTVCALSLVVHESAHLLVLRALPGRRGAGEVWSSPTQVWCVIPPLPPAATAAVAVVGPVAGALACAGLAVVGLPGWICGAVACVHAANLLPVVGDGVVVSTALVRWWSLRASPGPSPRS